jgi:hypothetical protein
VVHSYNYASHLSAKPISAATEEASWNTQHSAIQGFWFQDFASEP